MAQASKEGGLAAENDRKYPDSYPINRLTKAMDTENVRLMFSRKQKSPGEALIQLQHK
jgi:hypothetical protein